MKQMENANEYEQRQTSNGIYTVYCWTERWNPSEKAIVKGKFWLFMPWNGWIVDTCPCPYRFGCRNVKSIDSTPLHPSTHPSVLRWKEEIQSPISCAWLRVCVCGLVGVCVCCACENKWCAYISLCSNYMRLHMFARLLCEQILYVYRHLDAGPMKNRIVISFDDDQCLLCGENGCSQ